MIGVEVSRGRECRGRSLDKSLVLDKNTTSCQAGLGNKSGGLESGAAPNKRIKLTVVTLWSAQDFE